MADEFGNFNHQGQPDRDSRNFDPQIQSNYPYERPPFGGENPNFGNAGAEPRPMRYNEYPPVPPRQQNYVRNESYDPERQGNVYRRDLDGYDKRSGYYDSSADTYMPPPQRRRKNGTKTLLWCVCAVLGIVGAAVIMFAIDSGGGEQSWLSESGGDSSGYSSPRRNVGSDYLTESSLPDAPDVSADENGPQIYTQEAKKSGEVSTNQVNKAYEKASKSVVCITSYQAGSDYTITESGEGSGIIITADGYIATNSHVVNDSKLTGVMVTLSDGKQYLGTIIGIDKKTDLAVIKIDATGLTAAEFANSDDLFVGDSAYAIGNPGGSAYANSLTVGTVSAVERVLSTNGYVRYIQTDAAINPGNSGGALINSDGLVIGMNTAKLVATDYEGMGFAIPSNTLVEIVNKIIKYGYVNDRGTIGIEGSTATLYNSKMNNTPQGMIISKINSDSPLKTTEAQAGDIVTALNGKEIKSVVEFIDELRQYRPGEKVTLTLFRASKGSKATSTSFDVEVILQADTGE